MPGLESHQYRQVAESFGVDPERYDRVRPRYPDALVARIVAASPGPDVVDVGCGTGIAARQFRAAGGCWGSSPTPPPPLASCTSSSRALRPLCPPPPLSPSPPSSGRGRGRPTGT